MQVKQLFTYGGVEYKPGDEIDLDALEADDRADVVSRGGADAPSKKETGAKKDKAEPKE